jgi:hypothetical protein
MYEIRLARLTTAVGLFMLVLLITSSIAPGQPGKKKEKGKAVDDDVTITAGPNDDDTVFAPVDLDASYSTEASGLIVRVDTGDTKTWMANPTSGNVKFKLDYTLDTTSQDVNVYLSESNLSSDRDVDTRYRINFIKGGMMDREAIGLKVFGRAAKAAEAKGKPGDPIKKGPYFGIFPPYNGKPLEDATARVWVQGKFTGKKKGPPPPLRTYYDLAAGLRWEQQGEKWHPIWTFEAKKDLKAYRLKDDGETPQTVMRVLLLNSDGKVLHIMTHKHYE